MSYRKLCLNVKMGEGRKEAVVSKPWQISSTKDIMISELRMKTSFWKLVPWVICGAASTDPEVARRCMKEALQQYDHAVDHGMDSQPNISHPITRRFLAKDFLIFQAIFPVYYVRRGLIQADFGFLLYALGVVSWQF